MSSDMVPTDHHPDKVVTGGVDATVAIQCEACGVTFQPKRRGQRCHSGKCADRAYNRAHPVIRQRALPLEPPTEPVIPVADQRVPKRERGKLCLMSRAILERLERGPALASELQAMFPGARSVRTRISDVGVWVRPDRVLRSAPVRGVVGEWRYWLEWEK